MQKALSFNVLLESNLSYAHTMRQLFEQTRDKVDWYYGAYGQQIPFIIDRGMWKYVPVQWQHETPANLEGLMNQIKPDFIFMHDDPQRVQWLAQSPIPTLYWLPWDNEDPRVAQLPLIDKVSRTVVVAKFAQNIAERNGFDVGQIYNPIDTEVYHPDPEAGKRFKQRIGVPEDDQLILWVGRPGWRKRLLHILAIGAKLTEGNKHRHLLLHMDTNDPGMAYDIREALHSFGCLNGDRVIFPGNFRFDTGFPTEVMNEMYNACDLYIAPHGGEGMCVVGSSLIKTNKGYLPISEIKEGDMVLTHENRYRKVTKTMIRKYNGNGIRIKRWYGNEIICTPEHPILTQNGWKEAKDITINDCLVRQIPESIKVDNPKIPIEGDNKWWFLGLYLAEGSSSKHTGKISFGLHITEREYVVEKFKSLKCYYNYSRGINHNPLSKLEDMTVNSITIPKHNSSVVWICNETIVSFLDNWEHNSYNKSIPDEIFNYLKFDANARNELINGYIYGDGCSIKRKGRFDTITESITSTSFKLLIQIKELLEYESIFARLAKNKKRKMYIHGKFYECRDSWTLRWTTRQLYVSSTEKYYNIKIKSVENLELNEPVYNLEVEEDHTYTLMDGIVHNCLPMVEAMSCGKPFVATDVCTTQEFAHYEERGGDMIGKCGIGAKIGVQYEDKGIIRPSVDINDFVKKCEFLLGDETLRSSMGKNGRLFCQKEVDKRIVGAKWKQEFKRFELEMMG